MSVSDTFTLNLATGADIPVCADIIDAVFVEYDCVFVAADEVPDFVAFEQYFAGSHRAWAPWLDAIFAPAEGSTGEGHFTSERLFSVMQMSPEGSVDAAQSTAPEANPSPAPSSAPSPAPWRSLRTPLMFVVRRGTPPSETGFPVYYAPGKHTPHATETVTASPSDDIVGCIALKFNAEGPYLSRVYLRAGVRGLGLGRWMSDQMLHIARRQGFGSIHLWTDTRFEDAHRMYRKLGFDFSGDIRSLHDINKTFEWKMVAPL
jgi:GNAT superfamily N-acetyltransferase